jgi:hypothetical protein
MQHHKRRTSYAMGDTCYHLSQQINHAASQSAKPAAFCRTCAFIGIGRHAQLPLDESNNASAQAALSVNSQTSCLSTGT